MCTSRAFSVTHSIALGTTLLLASSAFADDVRATARISVEPRPPVVVVCDPEPIRVETRTDRRTYEQGDTVEVRFRVSMDSYVYVFSTEADGLTRQIFPNYYDRDNFIRANRWITLPDDGYDFLLSGPPGVERIQVFATTEQYDWLARDYGTSRARKNDPFPQAQMDPEEFQARLDSSVKAKTERARQAPPAAPTPEKRILPMPQAGGPGGRAQAVPVAPPPPSRIEVVPVEPVPCYMPPSTGRASYSYRVRSRYGARPPVIVVPRPGDDFRTGTLRIDSVPSRAAVYIDGYYYGPTPFECDLPEGKYDVLVTAPNYLSWSREVDLDEGRTERYSFRMRHR